MNDSAPTTPPSSSSAAPETPPSVPAPTPLVELPGRHEPGSGGGGQASGPRPFPGRARAGNEISVLFPLLTLYTVAYLALMLADFLLKDAFDLPEGMLPAYIALLGAYAADKEVRRWIGAAEPSRRGSLFVYFWLTFYLVAYIIHSFRPEYVLPNNLLAVCLQVLGIFFGSKTSKYLHGTRLKDDERQSVREARQAEILEMIKAAGKVTNRDVAMRFQISDRSASRLLAELAAQGHVRQMGERKGTYYILP